MLPLVFDPLLLLLTAMLIGRRGFRFLETLLVLAEILQVSAIEEGSEKAGQ